jgi:GT2 family glycosyltransferase
MKKPSLCISIVNYKSDLVLLEEALGSMEKALLFFESAPSDIEIRFIINDDFGENYYKKTFPDNIRVVTSYGHGNVGFGNGHNLALLSSSADYFLIANPDIKITKQAIFHALEFMQKNFDIGMLSPEVADDEGRLQYLCKKYPSVLLLFVRGFLPFFLRKIFVRYIRSFEFADEIDRHESFEPIIATGCFMLVRGDIFRKVGGFDPRFFLYFEDYDLTMRIAEHAKVVYDPSIKIIHHGGGASRKGWWHIKLFVTSAFRFFNKHGWRWY